MEEFMDFIDFVQYLEEPILRRYLRDLENPLEFFLNLEFCMRYRFSKETKVDVLLDLITNISYSINRGLPIPPILQLLTALRFYASSDLQIVSDDIRGINQATVSRIIKRVSKSLANQFKHYVKFPSTAEEWSIIQEQFYKIYRISGIGGFNIILVLIG